MKLKLLRRYIKSKDVGEDIDLHDQKLVIDGDYFRDMYQKSSSEFILGGEYDRFATYLRQTLNWFIESNITCYVVFKGAIDVTTERRLEIHKNMIEKIDALVPGRHENQYCEPIFVKDVVKEVLDELCIRYFVCEYDEQECLLSVAKHFACPILTHFLEYSIFGIPCVSPKSIIFKKGKKKITCTIYNWQSVRQCIFLKDHYVIAMLISIVCEDTPFYNKMPQIIECQEFRLVNAAIYWLRRKGKDFALKIFSDNFVPEEEAIFMKHINKVRRWFYPKSPFTIQYFEGQPLKNSYKYIHYVATGKISIPYINLKNKGTFSGSSLLFDKNRPDAMLPALEIVFYAYRHIAKSNYLAISFIGRKSANSVIWEIQKHFNWYTQHKSCESPLKIFLNDKLSGFDIETLKKVPESSWLTIITLLYYNKNSMTFTNGTYAALLSYVILSVVSVRIGLIKRNNVALFNKSPSNAADEKGITCTDCLVVGNNVLDLFYVNEKVLKKNYPRYILHNASEFEHCLQHMNYLNNLSGKEIQSTCYHRSLNMTFVYNIIEKLNEVDSPMVYIETLLGCASIFSFYKKIVDVYFKCQKMLF